MLDTYGVMILSGALRGGGALFVLWHKSISWALQSDDDRAVCL